MDATSSWDPVVILRMVLEHLLGLRKTYPTSLVRVYIEANMSYVSSRDLEDSIKATHGLMGDIIQIAKYDPKGLGRTGIWTTQEHKMRWKTELQRCIGTMRTVETKGFVTSLFDAHKDVSEIHLKLFCEQLLQMRDVQSTPANVAESLQLFAPRGITGKSAGKHDDRVAAFSIAVIHMIQDCFWNSTLRCEIGRPMLSCEDTRPQAEAAFMGA
jgi:hypothetical protein